MRTKALLCAAALAAGAITAMAQTGSNVYSLNVVGYYNVAVPGNNQLVLIANQMNTTNNTIGSLLANVPDGMQLFKYNGGWAGTTFDAVAMAWDQPNITLNPGEGCFLQSPTATTLTFVGEVLTGPMTNSLPIGALAIRSSMVPQSGLITTDLQYPAEDGDQLFVYNGGYAGFTYDVVAGAWGPYEPTNLVGQAFWSQKAPTSVTNQWTRNFTIP